MSVKNYCTRTPFFPQRAYLLALWFVSKKGQPMPYFYLPIFDKVNNILDHSRIISKQLKQEGIQLLPEILILPISFESLYPLKKEFWDNPTVKYDEWTRWECMLKATRYYKLHKLIVTSSLYQNKQDLLTAAYAYKVGTENEIEIFMKTSDFPVSKSSKYVAIYSIEEPIAFNTFTQRIIKSQDENQGLSIN